MTIEGLRTIYLISSIKDLLKLVLGERLTVTCELSSPNIAIFYTFMVSASSDFDTVFSVPKGVLVS